MCFFFFFGLSKPVSRKGFQSAWGRSFRLRYNEKVHNPRFFCFVLGIMDLLFFEVEVERRWR